MAPVEPSLSPSMDIQISSNFERLLFELLDRDGDATRETMLEFKQDWTLLAGIRARGIAVAAARSARPESPSAASIESLTHEGNSVLP